MDKLYRSSILSNEQLSAELLVLGISNFGEALNYIKQLPYGRNSNRSDFHLVLKEQKGTCSTKHAFLATLAEENNFSDVKLYLGIFKMCEENVPGVGPILYTWDLSYIPEAHCYLKINNTIIDVTSTTESSNPFENTIMFEEIISPTQIGNYKVDKHQGYIKQWIIEQAIPYNFETIWDIREACILYLSK
jgi:hypothetical protein